MKRDSSVRHEVGAVAAIVPSEHTASIDAVIFVYSGRVVQEKLDFWREEKAGA